LRVVSGWDGRTLTRRGFL